MLNVTDEAMAKVIANHRTGYRMADGHISLEADVQRIEEILRKHVSTAGRKTGKRVLDIGCGIGLAALGAFKIYGPDAEYVLLDKDGIEQNKKRAFFHITTENFGSSGCLDEAKEFLESNGASDVTCVDINKEKFPAGKFNIIMSALSCGFHYPVDTYSAQIKAAAKKGTVLLLDVRKEHMIDAVREFGKPVQQIEMMKHFTCVWKF